MRPAALLRQFFVGFLMGTADVIPGVSGGTMAFIFGIYDELLVSIKIITGDAIKLVLQGKLKEAIEVVPWKFLVPLFIGIGTAVVSLAKLMEHLLETYPNYVNAFFFGLVIYSIVIVSKRVGTWLPANIAGFAVTALVAFLLLGIKPTNTPHNLLTFFLAGTIAISAMILPGISGSFLLLIFGKYKAVMGGISGTADGIFYLLLGRLDEGASGEELVAALPGNVMTLAAFGVGCVLGIAMFSRLLTWLLKKNHDLMVACLAGLMLGSLRVIWPWQELVVTGSAAEFGKEVIQSRALLPSFDTAGLSYMGLSAVAIVIMVLIEMFQGTSEHHEDIDSPELNAMEAEGK